MVFLPDSTFHFIYITTCPTSSASPASPTSRTPTSSTSHTSSISTSTSSSSTSSRSTSSTYIYITYIIDIVDISPAKPLQCHLHRGHCTGVVTQELLHRSCSTANTHLADDIWLRLGPNMEDLLEMLAPCKSPEPLPLIQSVFLAMPCDHVVTASKWKKPPLDFLASWDLRTHTENIERTQKYTISSSVSR